MVPAEEVDGDPRDARLRYSAGRGDSTGLLRSLDTGRSPPLRFLTTPANFCQSGDRLAGKFAGAIPNAARNCGTTVVE